MTTFTVHLDFGRHVVRDIVLADGRGRSRVDAATFAMNAYGARSFTIDDGCPACATACEWGHVQGCSAVHS